MVKRISDCLREHEPSCERCVKSCAACHRDLPARDFTVNNRTKSGLSAYCRPCWNVKQRAYHAKWMQDAAFREKRRQKWQTWRQGNEQVCKDQRTKYYAANRAEILEKARAKRKPVVHAPRLCDICGATYTPKRSDSLTCGEKCRRKLNYERGRAKRTDNNHKRRAARSGVLAESFSFAEIAERDKWKCQLCGKPVNKALKSPHPKAQSLDHIVPIALGGEHSRANTQLAHLRCNISKGARIREPLQLALIG